MATEQYIPYSVRNNITDIEIGKLLDYLEREIGYDIIIIDAGFSVLIANEKDCLKFRTTKDPITSDGFSGCVEISGPAYMKIPYKLFYSTYKTLIPAIRNIYLK